jgi:hypothetical protein
MKIEHTNFMNEDAIGNDISCDGFDDWNFLILISISFINPLLTPNRVSMFENND